MNDRIVQTVNNLAQTGLQIIWQTGEPSFDTVKKACASEPNVHVFATLPDLYPYYALSRLVVGRAGASTLAEVAYFGLPCVLIPLPWAAENHQWVNAGLVESQGWGMRVTQDDSCGANVGSAVEQILSNEKRYHAMCMKALDNSPDGAAQKIVNVIMKDLVI
jgi:UDP-N-acetylglucosamine--N-acetylmuramyl-(pentapeptide) pyrophosphoryl-undecaprenol N-acetylglucosamine transferase